MENTTQTTLHGEFKHGMTAGKPKKTHMDFVVREATTMDMLEAEMEASTATPLNFNTHMAARQLVRVGDYEGPFTFSMVAKLHRDDWAILRKAILEVNEKGEDEPAAEQTD
jgi:phage FluMu protein gp41